MVESQINVIGFFTQQCPSLQSKGSDHIVRCMKIILSQFPICHIEIVKGANRAKVVSMYHDMLIKRNPVTSAQFASFTDQTLGAAVSPFEVAQNNNRVKVTRATHQNFSLHGFVVRSGHRPNLASAGRRYTQNIAKPRAPIVNVVHEEEEEEEQVTQPTTFVTMNLLAQTWNEF